MLPLVHRGRLLITEKSFAFPHYALRGRRIDGFSSPLLHGVVLRLVDPIMAAASCRKQSHVFSP